MKTFLKIIGVLALGFIIGSLAISRVAVPQQPALTAGSVDPNRTDVALNNVRINLAAASSSTVFSANEARSFLECSNIGSGAGTIYLDFGRNASLSSGFFINASTSKRFEPNVLINVLRVSAISKAANKIVCTQQVN